MDTPTPQALTLLLVENSRTARAVLSTLLMNAGYNVHCTATGIEAIEFLEANPVDLVIMDVFMPLKNGYEVTKEIRSSNKLFSKVPIIAYTASSNQRDEKQCIESGMNHYLIKSEDNKTLLNYLMQFNLSRLA